MGPEVAELEQVLAKFCQVNQAITCSSGTDALLLPLMAWGVGPGDAVFLPSFTFPATAEVVALVGATPILCDVLPDSFNLDPWSLEAAIADIGTAGSLIPKVIIAVDLFGLPADYASIRSLADHHGLKVLADAAQSLGASVLGHPVGSLADATATSFFPAKPLGCYGDGGSVFTDDKQLGDAIRSIRSHGKGSSKYEAERIGLNARLDTLQAAVLISKLEVFPQELVFRSKIAHRYRDGLSGLAMLQSVPPNVKSAWAQFTLRTKNRDALATALGSVGIDTAIYYPYPIHRQRAYASARVAPGGCPVADQLSSDVLSLPMHPYLTEVVQDFILEEAGRILQGG
ncbi:MAG: DegT/DnrJ/EryC1/StrS family aminotransferase [Dehalococcoidia bacterium]